MLVTASAKPIEAGAVVAEVVAPVGETLEEPSPQPASRQASARAVESRASRKRTSEVSISILRTSDEPLRSRPVGKEVP
jgi:hypothetical protein